MSTEEDTELRDLVSQTLEVNGCLPKIRAELRASIFLALDEGDELQKKQPLLNKKIKAALEQPEGRTMFCLVREFLEFFSLDFTVSVYEPESYLGTSYQYEGRSKVIEDLGIPQLKENAPLLLQLMQIAHANCTQQTNNIDINLRKSSQSDESSVSSVSDYSPDKQNSSTKSSAVALKENSINGVVARENLNETFDLSIPTINLLKTGLNDDGGKDSPLLELDESGQSSDKSTQCSEKSEPEFSPPVLNKSKFDVSDKLKSPQKTEKLKAKSSLSSLADLPPLQLSKSRNDTLLLPSLYSKEFKTSNQNLREIDKLFDVDVDSLDNYEEDFMSESEINLNRSHSDELPASFDSRKTSLSGKSVESKRSPHLLSNQNVERNKTEGAASPKSATSRNSSVISDDLNSNVDDILNSPTSI